MILNIHPDLMMLLRRYSGAVLATPDGSWPSSAEYQRRIEVALDSAGIKRWELSDVDNSGCEGAPLAEVLARAGLAPAQAAAGA